MTDFISSRLEIIDISVPETPVPESSFSLDSPPASVYISGDYAYVGRWQSETVEKLEVINISDKANPIFAGFFQTLGRVVDVFVSGKYAYAAEGYSGLQIIDISNPAPKTIVGSYNTQEDARETVVQGDFAYVTDGESGLFYIINISDPANPTLKSSFDTLLDRLQALAVSGRYAYVSNIGTNPPYDTQIIDLGVDYLTNPTPTLRGSYPTATDRLFVSGNYLYTANLEILDISDPDNITLEGSYDTTDGYSVYVQGDYAYVGTEGGWELPSFKVIDITDKANPTLVSSIDIASAGYDVYVQGNYAYVAGNGSDSGLIVIDVSDPALPAVAGSYTTTDFTTDVTVSGNFAYLSDADLQVIDISDPTKPTLENSYQTPGGVGWSKGADIVGNYAYLADGEAGLQVIKLNNPVTNVTVVDPNTITSTFPADLTEGPYDVLVTNPAGQSEEGYLYNGFQAVKSVPNDFDGDGKSDILWRHNTTGEIMTWFINGTTKVSGGLPWWAVSDLSWVIKDTGDFDGDGKSDILWRNNTSGEIYILLMDGITITAGGSPGTVSDLSWMIEDTGDFDGDGKSDILWRHNTTGEIMTWFINGTTKVSGGLPWWAVSDLNWMIEDTGDFDGDGKSDILWSNITSGEIAIVLMDGITITDIGSPGTVSDLDWQIQ